LWKISTPWSAARPSPGTRRNFHSPRIPPPPRPGDPEPGDPHEQGVEAAVALADRLRAARENPRGEMPFLEHLDELRSRIIWSLLAIGIFSIIGFVLVMKYRVLELLIDPVRTAFEDPNLQLIALAPGDTFWVTLKLGLVVGVVLASPVVVYQIWSFLSPALERHEKRAIIPAMYLGVLLFSAGVAMAYFIALPVTLVFFQGFQVDYIEHQLEVNRTLAFITKLLLGFGVIFELPVVIMALSAMGLVTPKFLRAKRRHAIVLITVLASFLTPGDVITLTLMMMVPLILLYEFSIGLSVLIYRRRVRKEEERLRPSKEPPSGSVEAG
jgi:sec-independent protein translocase protein TatC